MFFLVKYIYTFFKNDNDEEAANYILTIIDNHSIEYTINNNGIFINLNVIPDEILDVIHDYIISVRGNSIVTNDPIINTHVDAKDINYDQFIGTPDHIEYEEVDLRLLDISRVVLTI